MELRGEREAVEDFLFAEAALLDEWRLDEWLALFADDGTYIVPSTDTEPADALTVDPRTTLCLIFDDMAVLRSRVRRFSDRRAHAANPRARTRHMVSNVRIVSREADRLHVRACFLVSAARYDGLDLFSGEYSHRLLRHGDTYRIQERRAILDLQTLSPMGAISFLL